MKKLFVLFFLLWGSWVFASSEKSVSVEDCFNGSCSVSVNGSDYGAIAYKYESSGPYKGCYLLFDSQTITGGGDRYCPNYYDSSERLSTISCGKTSAYSLHDAMVKDIECHVNGHY